MPYIAPKDREQLDAGIENLAGVLVKLATEYGYDGAFAGLLNYTCTRIAMRTIQIKFGKMRYWLIAIVTGTFKNIADEFYRRVAAPYEEMQIEKSGDVPEYQKF